MKKLSNKFNFRSLWTRELVLLLSVFLSLPTLYAQQPSTRFQRISLEEGLSQASINCIFQDQQGFMWIGTDDGLNKYDGYEFTIYRNDPKDKSSLSNSFIWSIVEDKKGNLWIGTQGGGVNKFDRKTETFVHYKNEEDNPNSLSHNNVPIVFEDKKGTIWLGTNGGGLDKMVFNNDETLPTFVHHRYNPDDTISLSHNSVFSIIEDKKGNLWVGTVGGGLNRLVPGDNEKDPATFMRYQHKPDDPKSLSHNIVRVVIEDDFGYLWIGTMGGGLNKFDPKTEIFINYQNRPDDRTSLTHNSIWSLYQDSRGKIWVGTFGGGLNKFDENTETFTSYRNQKDNPMSLGTDFVQYIAEDAGGNLWVGTRTGALNLLDQNTPFIHFQNQHDNTKSISNNIIRSIFKDSEDNLWIGTEVGGLNKFNIKTSTVRHYINDMDNPKSLSSNIIRTSYEDSNGDFWIGTRNGLNKFDRKSETFTQYWHNPNDTLSISHNYVRTIFEDSGNNLWIGTSTGLNLFDQERKLFSRFVFQSDNPKSISHNYIYSIFEDSKGNLWIGTYGGGLNKLDRDSKSFTRYQRFSDDPDSQNINFVLSIFEDSRGDLWIGTDSGLAKFISETGTFVVFREKDGLPNNVVYGILEDNSGYLWVSTNYGISKFDTEAITFTNFDQKDGLQGNEFNGGAYYKDSNGIMYFGGINGLNAFDPEDIKENTYLPPIVITDFLLFNKSVKVAGINSESDKYELQKHINYTKEITLKHTDYIFAFEFSALNFRQSEKNQFAYKLEGFDEDWVQTDYQHRRATYTDLPYGDYIFKVKASNDDGYWNEEGVSVKLTVLPPWWSTLIAKIIYISLALALITVIYKTRTRKLKNQKKELEKLVQDRTEELVVKNEELHTALEGLESAQKHLIQSEKMASLGVLSNGVAHEINNPLNYIQGGIHGLSERIQKGAGYDYNELKPFIDSVNEGVRRATKIVKSLNQFSRQAGSDNELCDIHEIIDNCLEILKSKYLIGTDIQKNYQNSEVLVTGNSGKLHQAIMNILTNSGQAVKNSGKITIATSVLNQQVCISIKDNGYGIPEENLDKVTDPFFTTKGQGEGTGLGLFITHNVVKEFDGELEITSVPGKETEVVIIFPEVIQELNSK
jgi:ligand-binding sensor domain-containing protein/signal transduction histidine kinase